MHDWITHALTGDERDRFDRDGFVMVRGALDHPARDALLAAARHHDRAFRIRPGAGPHHVLNLHDLIGREPVFLDLVDHARTFPKVFGILGWNIRAFTRSSS